MYYKGGKAGFYDCSIHIVSTLCNIFYSFFSNSCNGCFKNNGQRPRREKPY